MSRVPSPTTITISLLEALISSKDKEENLVAREKNPLPQLRHHRDRATFGIFFVMESGIPKTLILFDHDKEAYSICVDLVWNKFRSNSSWLESCRLLVPLDMEKITVKLRPFLFLCPALGVFIWWTAQADWANSNFIQGQPHSLSCPAAIAAYHLGFKVMSTAKATRILESSFIDQSRVDTKIYPLIIL